MSSRMLFINTFGDDRTIGSIWVGGFVFKVSPKVVLEAIEAKEAITDFVISRYEQLTPSYLDKTKIPKTQLIVNLAAKIHSELQLVYEPLQLCSCHAHLHIGALDRPAKIVPIDCLESIVSNRLCKQAYETELAKLQIHYTDFDLHKHRGFHSKQLALKVLVEGPLFGIRQSYLKHVPGCWLDLLRMGYVDPLVLDWFYTPPGWWWQKFKVPLYHWFSNQEMSELYRLLRLSGYVTLDEDMVEHVDRMAGYFKADLNLDVLPF